MKTLPNVPPSPPPLAARPTFADIDNYAWLILQHERKPLSALAECRHEAELQLWAMWALVPPEQRNEGPAMTAAAEHPRHTRRRETPTAPARTEPSRKTTTRKVQVPQLSPA